VGAGALSIAARPSSVERTLGGNWTAGVGAAAGGGGTPGTDTSGADTGRLGTTAGAPTVRGGRIPGATCALAPTGAEGWLARWAWPVGRATWPPGDAAGDAGAGTGAAAVAGTVTAAAPAPDAGVAGGSLLVGVGIAARGATGAGTLGTDTAAGADTAAAPVTEGTAASAAPAPEAFTAAAAPSMALWPVDRPAWPAVRGDTVTPACAT
jgi:hypothetical protein